MKTLDAVKESTLTFFQLHWPKNWGETPHWSQRWEMQRGIENPKLPGCYTLFDDKGYLVYVGQGRRRADAGIARRLTDHVVNTVRRGGPYTFKEKWSDRKVISIHTLAFKEDQSYLALSLEMYLIRELDPKFNDRKV